MTVLRAGRFDELEKAQLRRLVGEACDLKLRESPYLIDAVAGILDWRERTAPDRLERHARRRPFTIEQLVDLVREPVAAARPEVAA